MNEVIKQRWVALGPRNYGKSIEWKLEGEPWDTEGLYADHTRGVYLLCLLLEAIQPLGWRLVSSAGEIRNVQIMLFLLYFVNFILESVHNYKECFSAEVSLRLCDYDVFFGWFGFRLHSLQTLFDSQIQSD